MNKNEPKTKPYNDIDLNNWKEYTHLNTGTFWEFADEQSYDNRQNFLLRVTAQLFERFTKKDDIVLDMLFSSAISEIEALYTDRKCIGVKMQEETTEAKNRLKAIGRDSAQFIILHPSYSDIINSNCETPEEFYETFEQVVKNGHDLLESGRFAALIIGDIRIDSKTIPLGFECMKRMEKTGFIIKAICVKNNMDCADARTANLWRYRALSGGFYIFEHEYIFIMQKT